jgi:hypothetical protein
MDDASSIMEFGNINIQMEWNEEHEKILVDWADKAMCYRWLHSKATTKYSYQNALFTIPVIIISTVTGTANFAQDRVPVEYISVFVMAVGALNILAGIISTIQQFLKISDLKESHRVCSIAWDKFYRNIKIELSKKPNERIPVVQMLKLCKEEYDRLMETSPNIGPDIITQFNATFKNTPTFDKIKKPEICDSLISTEEFRFKTDNSLINKTRPFVDKLIKSKELQEKLVTDFFTKFIETQGREPIKEEIMENLQDKVPIDKLNSIVGRLITKSPSKSGSAMEIV